MSAAEAPGSGGRTEPARPVGAEGEAHEASAVECPRCHAVNAEGVPFCGACGHDFVTGSEPLGPGTDDPGRAAAPPTSMQAMEPHEAYVDPSFATADLPPASALNTPDLDPGQLPDRPAVPPPTPPQAAAERVGHDPVQHLPPSRRAPEEWVAEVWVDHVWAATRGSGQPVPEANVPEVVPLTSHHVVVGRTNVERGLHPDLDAGTDMGVSVRHAQLTSDGERWWVEDLDTSNGTFVGTVGEPLPEEPLAQGERVRIDEDDRVYLGGWTRMVLRRAR
ncbi:FHA domain-containing protein [Ornithinimicrobium cerasi]|uniref:FHA domain-containing protein n=1 Tax=Ornithinimicrobium cerasi TaxID=2248773 RepID=UPI001F025856|nr:FHA domain-containing protein [Ornithinimicrobium cerasi]